MTRQELAYVLIRILALSIFVHTLMTIPWSFTMNENGGAMRTFQLREFFHFAVSIGLSILLWVNSPGLSKLVANP